MKNKELYLNCDCFNETIRFSKDEDNITYISILSHQYDCYKLSFFQRVKRACRILFKGIYYKDQIVLDDTKIIELKKWIEKNY